MSYKVNITTPCGNEEEIAVITATVLAIIEDKKINRKGYDLVVKKIKRTNTLYPAWNILGRHERFEQKRK